MTLATLTTFEGKKKDKEGEREITSIQSYFGFPAPLFCLFCEGGFLVFFQCLTTRVSLDWREKRKSEATKEEDEEKEANLARGKENKQLEKYISIWAAFATFTLTY